MIGAAIALGLPSTGARCRSIVDSDLESLRQWKNSNRDRFFHSAIITPADQVAWFQGYETRSEDFIFIVENDHEALGCLGVRLLDGQGWEIYNVMRVVRGGVATRALMEALHRVIAFTQERIPAPVFGRILKTNRASIQFAYRTNIIDSVVDEDDQFITVAYVAGSARQETVG